MKLVKKIMKVFGETSGLEEVSVFGSLSESVPEFTLDPNEIQKLNTYSTGWFNAVFGNRSPTIEDRNALDYLTTYQLTYLFQQGIPEYDSLMEYHADSYVKEGSYIYKSLIDSNLGNALTDVLSWENISLSEIIKQAFKNYLASEAVAGIGELGAYYARSTSEIKLLGKNPSVVHTALSKVFTYSDIGAWSSITLPSATDARGVAHGDNIAVIPDARATNGKLYNYNDDGTTVWKEGSIVETGPFYPNDIAYGNGFFIIAELNSRIFIINKNTIANHTIGFLHPVVQNVFISGIVFDNSLTRFIVAGTNPAGLGGTIDVKYSDDDGVTWTSSDLSLLPISNDLIPAESRLQIGNGMILFSTRSPADGNFIVKSIDGGVTWTIAVNPLVNPLPIQPTQLDFYEGYFILTSSSSRIGLLSKDGETWERFIFDSDATFNPMGLAYSTFHKRMIAVDTDKTSMGLFI